MSPPRAQNSHPAPVTSLSHREGSNMASRASYTRTCPHAPDPVLWAHALSPRRGLPRKRPARSPGTPAGPTDPPEPTHGHAPPTPPGFTSEKQACLRLPAWKPGLGPLRIRQFFSYPDSHSLLQHRTPRAGCHPALLTWTVGWPWVPDTGPRALWEVALRLAQWTASSTFRATAEPVGGNSERRGAWLGRLSKNDGVPSVAPPSPAPRG